MDKHNIAPHEGLDLHELLVFKNVCLTKAFTMIPLIQDEELKAIFRQDVALSRNHIKELKVYVETVNLQKEDDYHE